MQGKTLLVLSHSHSWAKLSYTSDVIVAKECALGIPVFLCVWVCALVCQFVWCCLRSTEARAESQYVCATTSGTKSNDVKLHVGAYVTGTTPLAPSAEIKTDARRDIS